MKFSSWSEPQTDFQIAPMLDIVFNLLAFFVVTSGMAQMEKEFAISLPEGENAQNEQSLINQIIINVDASGNVIVNNQKMNTDQLTAKLKTLSELSRKPGDQLSVIIRADENSLHKYVARIFDICARPDIRIQHVSISATQKEGASAPASAEGT